MSQVLGNDAALGEALETAEEPEQRRPIAAAHPTPARTSFSPGDHDPLLAIPCKSWHFYGMTPGCFMQRCGVVIPGLVALMAVMKAPIYKIRSPVTEQNPLGKELKIDPGNHWYLFLSQVFSWFSGSSKYSVHQANNRKMVHKSSEKGELSTWRTDQPHNPYQMYWANEGLRVAFRALRSLFLKAVGSHLKLTRPTVSRNVHATSLGDFMTSHLKFFQAIRAAMLEIVLSHGAFGDEVKTGIRAYLYGGNAWSIPRADQVAWEGCGAWADHEADDDTHGDAFQFWTLAQRKTKNTFIELRDDKEGDDKDSLKRSESCSALI